jgi:uncharacterized protein YndB with AHSA1/START domain
MTEFVGADAVRNSHNVTGLAATVDLVVAARPEHVWDLVADITKVGGWSPECFRADWLDEPGRARPGARFTGYNRLPNGFEYNVTCVITEADRPHVFAWVVLDESDDPDRPSSSWRYRIDPLPGIGTCDEGRRRRRAVLTPNWSTRVSGSTSTSNPWDRMSVHLRRTKPSRCGVSLT